MSIRPRRRFTAAFEEQAVARLSEPGATQASVSRELGITSSQLKSWRLEEDVEVMRKASAFFARWAAKP